VSHEKLSFEKLAFGGWGIIVLKMKWNPFEAVGISPEPGAVSALGRGRKMLASNTFRKPPRRFFGIHLAIVIHEQPCCISTAK
jgi:hypothetical protein